ncbi:helix-turn-helix domain-containing protein [Paenibacillus sp. TAB 01]|uniref:helix-turn-helix domain-containing protein n=1 Tax=Paenibacillus sp. TAB 01 TaxID=3368988 RepID=UPI003752D0E2
MEPWRFWIPSVISHVFWYRKKAFQLKEDTYADWVLFAVQAGSFRYRIGEASGEAGFGDAVLCPPGVAFEREVIEPVTFHFYTIGWERSMEEAVELSRGAGDSAAEVKLKESAGAARGLRGSGGDMQPDELSVAESTSELVFSSKMMPVHLSWLDHNRLSSTYFYMEQLARLRPGEPKRAQWNHFLHDLWQLYGMEQEVARQTREQQEQDPLMQEAERWLRQQAFGPILLKELSARLGLSPVQLTRQFHAACGATPMDYLTSLRIQKAKALLLETDMTLEQIAEQCGYENGFYLSRMFSKTMKVSPSRYRSMHRL